MATPRLSMPLGQLQFATGVQGGELVMQVGKNAEGDQAPDFMSVAHPRDDPAQQLGQR
jgi:hypothetical protein